MDDRRYLEAPISRQPDLDKHHTTTQFLVTGRRGWTSAGATVSGREVDFLLTMKGKPWAAVEAKVGETQIDPALRYFRDRLKIPFVYQVVLNGTRDFVEDGIRCV